MRYLLSKLWIIVDTQRRGSSFRIKAQEDVYSGYENLLWLQSKIKEQRLNLEQICNIFKCLFVLNVVAHPELARIELLWRDVQYDYRQPWVNGIHELKICWTSWLDNDKSPLDGNWAAMYYNISSAYLEYYNRGGKEWQIQYHVRKLAKSCFSSMSHGDTSAADGLQNLCTQVPGLLELPLNELFDKLEPYVPSLNWLRKRPDGGFDENEDPCNLFLV